MQKRSRFLMMAVPVALILLGLTIYEYGYLDVKADIAAQREAALAKEKTLRKYLAVIATKPGLERQLADLQGTRAAENEKIIEGQTSSIAAAALQNMVNTVLSQRGGVVSTERIEKPEDLGKFKIITLTVDAVFPDTRTLTDALFALETQRPSIVVRDLDATVRNLQTPRELTVRLKLSGLTGGR
jgi:hypothetical protein